MKLHKISTIVWVGFFAFGFSLPMASLAAGPATLDLHSIGTNNIVILSKTGVTNTGSHTSVLTGNIGSSPITATAMNGIFCSEITGTIYGVDAAYTGSGAVTCFAGNPPLANKTLVDTAVLNMGTAYTDAAGRTLPDGTNLYSGNIGGQTFPPGLYKWTTDVTIPTSVTLSGGANDVWIFQIAGNLNVASGGSVPAGVKIILAGGAQASNVFWQVGGGTGATLGTYSTFNGTILSATQVILQTGVVLNGRALAQTQVTLDANTVTVPTPTTSGPVFIDTNTNGILDLGEQFFSTIQAAIIAAPPGSTIFVTSGTYNTSGQILINKNLHIVGSGIKPILRPTANRAAGNAADAWLLVSPGVTFSLSNVVMDGSTFFVWQAVRSHGNTTITNVDFRNIQGSLTGSPYRGVAIENFGGTIPGGGGSDSHGAGGLPSTLTVSDSTFAQIGRVGVLTKGTGATSIIQHSVYTGKGDGLFLDYALEVGAGGLLRASNNSISGNRGVASDGSTSGGILVTDYYGTGTRAEVSGNSFSSNFVGLGVGFDATDESVVTARDNDFSGETIGVLSTAPSVNAAYNWWGTIIDSEIALKTSGPVVYTPWYTDATLTTLSTDIDEAVIPEAGSRGVATINVVKVVVNDSGGAKLISDFPIFVNGRPVASGMTNTFAAPASVYVVTETRDPNYVGVFSGDCDVSGRINLNPGDNKFCIITNNDIGVPIGVPPVPPLIEVVKIPSPLALPAGPGLVTYTYTLRNIGTVPVTNITMVGDSCAPVALASGDTNTDAKLDVGEVWVYTCQMNLTQTTTNIITATGWANGISAVDIAGATVVVGVPGFPDTGVVPPLIHVTKIPSPIALSYLGGYVMYTYAVTNPGAVSLHDIKVADDKCSLLYGPFGDTNNNNLLEPSEHWAYACRANLNKTTTNTVSVSGQASGLIVRDIAIVTVVVAMPSLPNMGSSLDVGQQVRTIAGNLGQGGRGNGVTLLQEFLIAQHKGPAAEALARVGATAYFGGLTRAALAEFQANAKITPASGYFGPITREYLRIHAE